MPGGRPPKPTHLKVLAGDRKDRINTAEPVPSAGEVVPPWPLTNDGQAVWDRLAPDRIAKGVLTAWDADAFGFFCEAVAIARFKIGAAHDKPEPGAASGVGEFRTAVSVVSSLGGRFGWTPSDRQKIVIGERSRSDSSDDLLSG